MKKLISLLIILLTFFNQTANAVGYSPAPEVVSQRWDLAFEKTNANIKAVTASVGNSVGASVELEAAKTYPIAVIDTAKNTTVATLEATVKSKPLISPSVARMAKGFGMGVAQNLVAMVIYHLLNEAVDYVLDPANNTARISYADKAYKISDYSNISAASAQEACNQRMVFGGYTDGYTVIATAEKDNGQCLIYGQQFNGNMLQAYTYKADTQISLDTIAQTGLDMASEGDSTAQDGVKQVVQNMVSNNEIGDDVYNQNITYDNSNDVINNYITNNYPSANTGVTGTGTGATSVGSPGTTTNNGNGTTTNTTTTNNTTNNTTTTTTTTTNVTNNNITNVTINQTTINNPATNADPQDKTKPKDDSASSPASTPAPTSAPSPTKPTDSKPFELPKFCDWASTICDFITWVKQPPPDPQDEPIEIKDRDKPDFDLPALSYQPYIQFPANCPNPPTFLVFGQTFAFPIEIFCKFCDEFSYVILAFAWLRALLIVGSGFKGQ